MIEIKDEINMKVIPDIKNKTYNNANKINIINRKKRVILKLKIKK